MPWSAIFINMNEGRKTIDNSRTPMIEKIEKATSAKLKLEKYVRILRWTRETSIIRKSIHTQIIFTPQTINIDDEISRSNFFASTTSIVDFSQQCMYTFFIDMHIYSRDKTLRMRKIKVKRAVKYIFQEVCNCSLLINNLCRQIRRVTHAHTVDFQFIVNCLNVN